MRLTPEQRNAILKAEAVILAHDSTEDAVVAALNEIDALGLPRVSQNFRHMVLEWRGFNVSEPQNLKAARHEAPPPTVSNPKA